MFELATALVTETARVLYEGSLYILLGFGIAGLLQEFLPGRWIARHLGAEGPRTVVYGSLLGIAMPLCSCGVVPAAASLRRKGASRSSITAFLISTPETGEEAIALTWGMLGPVMAIVRPIVAVVTAIVAGLLVLVVPDPAPAHEPLADCDDGHDHADTPGIDDAPADPARSRVERLRSAGRYGFFTLLDELAFWLAIGIVLTGVLAALLPADFFSRVLGWDRGIVPMLGMLAVGVPLYLCASASTPVAAALVAKGLSPGAALVFLLTGPATNVATIGLVGQMLGRRVLHVYLGTIAAVAVAAGLLLDAFAADRVRSAVVSSTLAPDGGLLAMLKIAAAFLFVALLAVSFRRTRFREARRDLREHGRALARVARGIRLRDLARPPVLAAIGVVLLVLGVSRSVLVVGPGERGVVQRFGRVVAADLEPGLHLHWPSPISRGFVVDVAGIRQLAVGFQGSAAGERPPTGEDAYFLTADENLIDLRSVVHWRVSEPARFALGLEQAESLLRAIARHVLVAVTVGRRIDSVYTDGRVAAERAYHEILAREVATRELGIEVLDARLLDVHAPATVHDAFRDVASALEDRQTEVHDANGYAAERLHAGEGEAVALTEAARAEANRVARYAEGAGAAFAGIARAHAADPLVTERRLWFESLDRALPAPRKYVLAPGAAGGEIDLWLGGNASGAAVMPLPPSAASGRKDGRTP